MPGPGIYLPDATEGITRPEDLPAPRVIERSRTTPAAPAPSAAAAPAACGPAGRTLHDLGDPLAAAGPPPRPALHLLAAPLPRTAATTSTPT